MYAETQLDDGSRRLVRATGPSDAMKRRDSPVAELRNNIPFHQHRNHNEMVNVYCRTPPLSQGPPPDVQAIVPPITNIPGSPGSGMITTDPRRIQLLEDILSQLKVIVAKQEADEEDNRTVNEWRNVAEVVDRALFRLFFAITLIVTVVLLVFVPLSNIEPVP